MNTHADAEGQHGKYYASIQYEAPKEPKPIRLMKTMKEFWPIDRIRELLSVYPEDHHDVPTLKYNLAKADKDGWVQKKYSHGAGLDFGRLFCKYSYQSISGQSRDYLLQGTTMYDLDADNCFPVVMLQEYQRNGILVPILTMYVNNREDIIKKIIEEHPHLDRKAVKIAFIVALHNGNYIKHATGIFVPLLNEFRTELEVASDTLFALPGYKLLHDRATKISLEHKARGSKGKQNITGTTISWICQIAETKVGAAVCAFLKRESITPRTNMFDGFIGDVVNSKQPLSQILHDMSPAVHAHTGYKMNFSEKPIKAKALSDMYTASDLPTLGPNEKLVLFDLDGTLAVQTGVQWSFRSGIKKLAELQKSGTRVGLFTNKARSNIPFKLLREAIDRPAFRFDVVLAGEECYKPTDAYKQAHNMDQYDRMKSIQMYFPLHADNVCIVDDTPAKIPLSERQRLITIPTWDGVTNDEELATAIKKACVHSVFNALPFGNGPNVTNLEEGSMTEFAPGKYCINPIEFEKGQRLLVIGAGMNNGKSHQTKAHIKKYEGKVEKEEKEGPEVIGIGQLSKEHLSRYKRILVVTARVQQTHTSMGLLDDLGFSLYSDIKGSLSYVDRLVCQFESLHRTVPCAPWDLIVADEIRSVAQQCISTSTNKDNLGVNNEVFTASMKCPTTRTIFLDAHIEVDGVVKSIVDATFEPHEWRMHRYTRVALDRKFVVMSDLELLDSAIKKIESGGKVMCAFRSREQMLQRAKALESKCFNVLKLHSSSDDELMKMFADINADHLKDVDALLFTSKVTVGADIQQLFSGVFIFADTRGGCTARDMLQMMGRARNTSDPVVAIAFPTPGKDRFEHNTPEFESVRNDLLRNQATRQAYAKQLAKSKLEFNDGMIVWSSDLLTEMLAWSIVEQETGFQASFKRLARHCGYQFITLDAPPADPACEVKHLHEESVGAAEEEMFERICKMRDIFITMGAGEAHTYAEAAEGKVKSRKATEHDHLTCDVYHAMHAVDPVHWVSFECHEIKNLMDSLNRRKVRRACMVECGNRPRADVDAKSLVQAPMAETTRLAEKFFRHLDNAVAVAGLSFRDAKVQVPLTNMTAEVKEQCDLAAKADGRKPSKSTSKRAAMRNKYALVGELEQVGYKLESSRTGSSRTGKVKMFNIKPLDTLGRKWDVPDHLLIENHDDSDEDNDDSDDDGLGVSMEKMMDISTHSHMLSNVLVQQVHVPVKPQTPKKKLSLTVKMPQPQCPVPNPYSHLLSGPPISITDATRLSAVTTNDNKRKRTHGVDGQIVKRKRH
jgi:hypothetical protein